MQSWRWQPRPSPCQSRNDTEGGRARDFPGLEARLEDSPSSGARTGTYRTATISHRARLTADRLAALAKPGMDWA
ncbi:hypothetical protein ACWGE1_26730 [Streptomyces sp. NPDC054932]